MPVYFRVRDVLIFIMQWRLKFVGQDKAYSRLGVDEFHFEVLIHLLAQIVDVDIDKVGSCIEVCVPYLLSYFYTAYHFFGILDQIHQQVIFLGREFNGFALPCYFPTL